VLITPQRTCRNDACCGLQRGGAAHGGSVDSFSLNFTVGALGPGRDTLSCLGDCKIRYSGYTETLVCRGRSENLDFMCLVSKWLMAIKSEPVACLALCA